HRLGRNHDAHAVAGSGLTDASNSASISCSRFTAAAVVVKYSTIVPLGWTTESRHGPPSERVTISQLTRSEPTIKKLVTRPALAMPVPSFSGRHRTLLHDVVSR